MVHEVLYHSVDRLSVLLAFVFVEIDRALKVETRRRRSGIDHDGQPVELQFRTKTITEVRIDAHNRIDTRHFDTGALAGESVHSIQRETLWIEFNVPAILPHPIFEFSNTLATHVFGHRLWWELCDSF